MTGTADVTGKEREAGTETAAERSTPDANDLREGALYVCKRGELIELEKEEDDGVLKVRLVKPVAEVLYAMQKQCRKRLNGYKPDVSQVTAALIVASGEDVDAATDVVINHCLRIYSSAAKQGR